MQCRDFVVYIVLFFHLTFTPQTLLDSAQSGRHGDDYSDTSSSSELSDILEVEEEDTGSHASVRMLRRSPIVDDRIRSSVKVSLLPGNQTWGDGTFPPIFTLR